MAKDEKQISFGMVYGAICAGIVLVVGMIILHSVLQQRQSDNKMHAYVLGEAESCGYIGVKIAYDLEPVDVLLYSPDGQKFAPGAMNVYYKVDEDEHTVTLMADSDKLGIWSAEFNTKKNKKIDYCFVQTPSDTLYMNNPVLYIGDDGGYHVKFTTSVSSKDYDEVRCSIMLEKTSFSYCVTDVKIPTNEEVDIPLTFPDHVFTDEKYSLKINVFSGTDTAPVKHSIDVHIGKKPEAKEPLDEDEADEEKSEED